MKQVPGRALPALVFALLPILAALACSKPSPVPESGTIRLLRRNATASIGPETRLSLILKPPKLSHRRFQVTIPPGARLAFGFGIPNASLASGARPATFEVSIETASGARQELFRRRLDPGVPADRRWFDVEQDLSAFAGQRVSLDFAGAAGPGEGPPPLCVYGNPVVYEPGHHDARRSVVVLSIDTLRARDVGAYGYPRNTSPYIDSLAAQGSLFENAITTSVTTGPSHMSLFTGLYPVNHGLSTGLEYKPKRIVTLARVLHEAGYQTAAFTEDGYIIRTRGFGDGFVEYTENHGLRREGPGEVKLTYGQAERWMERARPPFYLFVHTYQVHSPYRPPEAYRHFFVDDGLPGPEDPVMRRQHDNYDREIRYVDDKVKELLTALGEHGLRENTLIVLLADHGEEFQEHGYYQHGGDVFEETIRIPMIFVGPGIPARRYATQVSLIDVMPTVLDYVGAPIPPNLDGISLLPAIKGAAKIPERTLYTEARGKKRWLRPFKGENWSPVLIGMRTQHAKSIVHRPKTGKPEPPVHYDLRKDALEASPRLLKGKELAAAQAAVDRYLHSRLSPEETPKADSVDKIDPEVREQLKRLGYLDDDD